MKISRYTPYEKLPDVLTPTEVAAYLTMDVDTIRDYIRDGSIRATRCGRNYKIRKQWILAFLEYFSDSELRS